MALLFLRKKTKKKASRKLKPEEMLMKNVFVWIDAHRLIADVSHHTFNEGKRTPWEGALMKALGLRAGVPDIYIDYPTKTYHGLRIEVKERSPATGRYGRPTAAQIKRVNRLNELGYCARFCYGFDETIKTITDYLKS